MVDGLVEDIRIGECLMVDMMSLKITPDNLDVVEFGRIFWATTRRSVNGPAQRELPRSPC
jgi:hypothetical protein